MFSSSIIKSVLDLNRLRSRWNCRSRQSIDSNNSYILHLAMTTKKGIQLNFSLPLLPLLPTLPPLLLPLHPLLNLPLHHPPSLNINRLRLLNS
jgi:hypothetical protein